MRDPAERPATPVESYRVGNPGPTWTASILMTASAGLLGFVVGFFAGGRAEPVAITPQPLARTNPPVAAPTPPKPRVPPAPVVPEPAPEVPPKPAPKPEAKAPPKVIRSPTTPKPEAVRDFASAPEAFAFAKKELAAGKRWRAVEALRKAVKLNPVYADAHRLLGDTLGDLKENADAVRHYKLYLVLRPGAADAAAVKAKVEKLSK